MITETKTVRMTRDPAVYPDEPRYADIHPDEVENCKLHGWTECKETVTAESDDEVARVAAEKAAAELAEKIAAEAKKATVQKPTKGAVAPVVDGWE